MFRKRKAVGTTVALVAVVVGVSERERPRATDGESVREGEGQRKVKRKKLQACSSGFRSHFTPCIYTRVYFSIYILYCRGKM